MLLRTMRQRPIAGMGFAARLLAAALVCALAAAHAATSMATKKDEGFQTSVPNAILLDPDSDSVLFEKNGDQLVAPASLAKLMTLEFVFNEIKQGRIKLDDEYIISENAWRKGGAPSHGSTMFAAIHSRVKLDDLIHGIIVDSANDACIAIAEGARRQRNRLRRDADQARARDRAGKIDLHQRDRLFRPQSARHGARNGAARAPHHADLSRLLSVFRRARIHLEQHPPAEPQSAAGHGHRRRRAQDRRNLRGRLQPGRLGGAGQVCA